jgi:integrase
VKSFITALDRRGMSESRQRQTYRLLSLILKAAVEAGCLGLSPCIGVKIKRHQLPEQVILTPQQVGILAGAPGTPNDLLCYVLAFGGLRWGEAAALRRSRCDVTRSRVQVVESLASRRATPFRPHEDLRAPVGQATELRGADARTTPRENCSG